MDHSEFEFNWNQSNDEGNKTIVAQTDQDDQQTIQGLQKPSFIEKLRGKQPKHVEISDLPNPVMRGNILSIRLPKQAVERGKLFCNHCLVGRLDFKKISLSLVKTMALKLWGPESVWKIIPLGKGF
ncbi:hypothetical protein FRX31_022600 [Thalictrum thalictroides]|uniref:Uncharacterized protein n=1 Tax=Thalictrum thalictroides TaxID=46969 RepID=A0A7J6VRU2_THATH|nr:hypothetical protein FRX31_022600 [Thalictrum thalictroides]